MKETTLVPVSLVVGVDAATPISSVALAAVSGNGPATGRLLAFIRRESRQPASCSLLDDLNHLLRDQTLDPHQMKAVAVTHGPGMFTGLRVGLALAKTLAHGWGVPLYGYSTLEITARRCPVLSAEGTIVCVLLDARRGELYSGLYRLDGSADRPVQLRPDRVEPVESVLAELEASPWPAIVFSGNGAALVREQINARLGARARWLAAPWDGPGADALALAAASDLAAGRPGVDPLGAMPVYLRVSDAEKRHPATK